MPTLKSEGLSLNYEIYGADSSQPVIMSNSLGTTMSMWKAQVAVLSKKYRLICYDTRGHGGSERSESKTTSIASLADDVVHILDELQIEKAHFIGLSLGGMIGQSLAARYPFRVSSLVLMSTAAHMNARDSWVARADMVRNQGMGSIANAIIERWFTPDFLDSSPAVVDRCRAMLMDIDPLGYAACAEAIGDMDLRESNRQISAPTLLLPADNDPATPVSMSEDIQSHINRSTLSVIRNAAHLSAVEQPISVNEKLESWLSSGFETI